MKILLAHNNYGAYSGEEAVVDRMDGIFRQLGHEVVQLRMSTEDVRDTFSGKLRTFFSGIWCPTGVKAMRKAIEKEHPDVVNVHNLYPFISPAALRECKKAGIPVIMTVHNYRLICPTGLFMHNGQPCELCLKAGNEWNCIRHNCENSLPKSLAYAARNAVARSQRHYFDCIDRFACITAFQKSKLIEAGFDQSKIAVIPNTVDLFENRMSTQGNYVAYCGRISAEKGVDLILDAARRLPNVPFKIAGAVRDHSLISRLPQNAELLGHLSGEQLHKFFSDARFIVLASRWYEGFPMTILEAAQYGKPAIAPNHGAFSEIIGEGDNQIGLLFSPGDAGKLTEAISALWRDKPLCESLGKKALAKLQQSYSTTTALHEWQHLLSNLHFSVKDL